MNGLAPASRDFLVMAKPIGPVCNLNCHYCYYLSKTDLYPGERSFRMSAAVLEAFIAQTIAATPRQTVTFAWHGGEPTLLGLDYFDQIVALQRRHLSPGRSALNVVQTNGVLLDDAWCRFFARERFSVGVSLDGPRELHDGYRVTRGEQPTFAQAQRGLRLLQAHGVETDVLCVLHDRNVAQPLTVYQFFVDLGVRSLKFIPLVEPVSGAPGAAGPRSVSPAAYGAFLCQVFDRWVRHDVGRVAVQIFEEAARAACGLDHAACIFRETCGDVLALEHNGDLYACDHYVQPDRRIGNITAEPLAALVESPAQRRFGEQKRDGLPRRCRSCPVRALCNGGCPKDRITPTGEGDCINYLCDGYRRFFTHSLPYMQQLARLLRAGRPVQELMAWARARDRDRRQQTGRNDPCACGSGRKFKHCCLPHLP